MPKCKNKGCGVLLIVGENWYPAHKTASNYICNSCHRQRKLEQRRAKGVGPRSQKYGVPSLIDGKRNPEWKRRQYRAVSTKRGVKPHPPPKFNIPCKLPNGKHNPEYDRLWRRSKGIPPRKKRGDNKYGVPAYLPDGRPNLEYHRRIWHARKPASKERKVGKYGIRTTLPDGRRNPEYEIVRRRAHGVKPISNKYGVPTHLPDGSRNPEYSKLRYQAQKERINQVHRTYIQSEQGKLVNSKHKAKLRQLPPLQVIIGKPFEGAELHHMSKTVGIWVPRPLNHLMYHNVWTGKNMEKVNLVAIRWYVENAADLSALPLAGADNEDTSRISAHSTRLGYRSIAIQVVGPSKAAYIKFRGRFIYD